MKMNKLIMGMLILPGSSLPLCAGGVNICDSEFVGISGFASSVTNYGWKIISSGSPSDFQIDSLEVWAVVSEAGILGYSASVLNSDRVFSFV